MIVEHQPVYLQWFLRRDDVSLLLLHVLFIAVLQWSESWPVARRSNFDVTESELESLGAPRSERPRSFTGSLDVSRTTRWYFKRFCCCCCFGPLFEENGPILTKILQCKWFEAIK